MVQNRTQDEPWYRYIVSRKWAKKGLRAERLSQEMRAANMSAGIGFRSTQTKSNVQGQFTTEPPPQKAGSMLTAFDKKNATIRTGSKKNDRYKVNKEKKAFTQMVLWWPVLSRGWLVLSYLSKKTWAWGVKRKTSLLVTRQFLIWIILGREKGRPADRAPATQPETSWEKQEVWFPKCATVLRGLLPWLLDGLPAEGASIWKRRVRYPYG